MASLKHKLLVAGVVVGGAIAYLAYAGTKQGWVYYVPVEQFAADATQQQRRVRLMGSVAPDGIDVPGGRMEAKFTILGAGGKGAVPVHYRGSIPDLFKAGCDVVVEGKLDPAGTFQADVLLTKCASKYDAKHPGAKDPATDPKPGPNPGLDLSPSAANSRQVG